MSNKSKAVLIALALIVGAVIVNKASESFQSFQQNLNAQYAGQ